MQEFKHDHNKVIEAVAQILKDKFNFNPLQVIRNFQIFTMNYFNNTPDVPDEDKLNWYYLRDSLYHSALIFNYETKEFKLIEPGYKWKNEEFLEKFKKSEQQLAIEYDIYRKNIEKTQGSYAYQTLKPVIEWYFSCPLGLAKNMLPSPNDLILSLLKKYTKGLKLSVDNNLEEVRESIFETYFYEEKNSKKKD